MNDQDVVLKIILEEIEKSKKANKRFSLRAFAKKMELSPSVVSEIVRKKRQLTKKTSIKILKKLRYEAEAIELLTATYSNRQKKSLVGKKDLNFDEMSSKTYQILSHWRYFAILSLLETNKKNKDSVWIALKLGLTKKQVNQSLKLLHELNLIRIEKNARFETTGKQYTTSSDVINLAVQASHLEHLLLAKQSLLKDEIGKRDFSTATLTFNKKKIVLAKKMITDFRRKFCAKLETSDDTDVYRVGIQFFPLSVEDK